MASIGVAIGTFGSREWAMRGIEAGQKLADQTRAPDQISHRHANNLSEARNLASGDLHTDYQIFLDADDELDPAYINAMYKQPEQPTEDWATGLIYRPCTLGMYPDGTRDEVAVMIQLTDLMIRNCIVIGAMHKRKAFQDVGGFRDFESLEDWDLWTRMHYEGNQQITQVPEAVYCVGVNPDSRNSDAQKHGGVYRELHSRNKKYYQTINDRVAARELQQRVSQQSHGSTPVRPQ